MNKEIKKRWVEALRSGDYKQGTGLLRSHTNEFCCLGVLADLVNVHWQTDDLSYFYRGDSVDWYGNIGYGIIDKVQLASVDTLITMNDHGDTFKEIADWIEENE